MLIFVPSFDGYQTCSTSAIDGSTGTSGRSQSSGGGRGLREIDAKDRRRIVEAREREKCLGAIFLGRDGRAIRCPADCTSAERSTVEIEHLDDVRRVLQIRHGDRPAAERDRLDHGVRPLGHDVAPMVHAGLAGIDGDDAPLRRAFRRLNIQRAVDDRAGRRPVGTDRHDLLVDMPRLQNVVEIGEPEIVRLRVDPVAQHEPVAVARQRAERSPRRRELRVLGLGELAERAAGLSRRRCRAGERALARYTDPSGFFRF